MASAGCRHVDIHDSNRLMWRLAASAETAYRQSGVIIFVATPLRPHLQPAVGG
jgi:hypothetical protein